MSDAVEQARAAFAEALESLADPTQADMEALRVRFLGKKGELSGLMRHLGGLAPEDRPAFGAAVNALKNEVSERIESLQVEAADRAQQAAVAKSWLDPTLPSFETGLPKRGHLHPITHLMDKVIDHFRGMGFEVASGPGIEDTWHNFDALNIPGDHPARDVWDTFYTTQGEVPRTHTSSVQIRTLAERQPPLRIIAPGKCFRNETIDATHHACFHQVEGLYVDKTVTIGHLKSTLEGFVETLFGKGLKTRFRPAFYPFVEPGLDLDVSCIFCGGSGTQGSTKCGVCKGGGWIEVIPCGLVHPNVLRNCGHDPDEWQGFAFGMGFDRLVMLQYGIDDIRRLYEGRLDLVRQF